MPPSLWPRWGLVSLLLAAPICRAQAPAPARLKPVLDEAASLEHSGRFIKAGALYAEALSVVPGSRHARLGLARVARAQYRLDDARVIYEDLLRSDPDDFEAANGMAWLALANYRSDEAREGFNAVLAKQPGNAEALAGLAGTRSQYRYRLDVSGGPFHSDPGTAWGGEARLSAALDASGSVEVALRHNSRELATANPLDAATLPSNVLRLGYGWQVPGKHGVVLAYEHRDRKDDPTEQRLEASANTWVTDGVQLSGGLRKGFGTGWNATLAQAGVTVRVGGPWEITTTGYWERRAGGGSREALALDLVRQGPGHALLVVGASRANNPTLTDVHGTVVFPIGKDRALTATVRRNTFRGESQLELGWRQFWN